MPHLRGQSHVRRQTKGKQNGLQEWNLLFTA